VLLEAAVFAMRGLARLIGRLHEVPEFLATAACSKYRKVAVIENSARNSAMFRR
jgi:hypothetical protein